MPIYEYACEKCGYEFEREQRITDEPVKTCPKCRAKKVRRLISRTAFVLKGGGWYSDLYASPKPESKGAEASSSGSTEQKGAAASEPKAEPKGDAKPESKSGPKPKGGGSKAKASKAA